MHYSMDAKWVTTPILTKKLSVMLCEAFPQSGMVQDSCGIHGEEKKEPRPPLVTGLSSFPFWHSLYAVYKDNFGSFAAQNS